MTKHNQHTSVQKIVSHGLMLWDVTIQSNTQNKMTMEQLVVSLRGCGGVKCCTTAKASNLKLQH